jgi:hypothetical protein
MQKNLFYGLAKRTGNLERKRQIRIVFAGLDCVNRSAGDTNASGRGFNAILVFVRRFFARGLKTFSPAMWKPARSSFAISSTQPSGLRSWAMSLIAQQKV